MAFTNDGFNLFNLPGSDPTGGGFGQFTQGLPELGISENVFGGETGSIDARNQALLSPLQGPQINGSQDAFIGPQPIIGPVQTPTGTDDSGRETFIDPVSGEERTKKTDEGAAQREVESLFGETSEFLNRQESALRGSEQELLGLSQAPFEQALPGLQQATQEGVAKFGQGQEQARATEQRLLADARRLGDELQRRGIQRFGGIELSSAAQASSEIGGRELQRQLGQVQQNTATTVQNLQRSMIDFENQAKAKIQELNFKKAEALQRAQLAFRDSLAAIDAQRAQLGQNKAIAKLDLLREFRDRAANIQQQSTQFAQQIELIREQSRVQAQSQIDAFSQAGQTAQSFIGGQNQALTGTREGTLGSLEQAGTIQGQGPTGTQLAGQFRRPEEDRNSPFGAGSFA